MITDSATRWGDRAAFLARHGSTEWSRTGRHTGLTDVPLDDEGRRQAEQLAGWLSSERFALVLSSPASRAMDTCRLAGLGDRAEVWPGLHEWDYGSYEGLTTAEIRQARSDWSLWSDGCPRGETAQDVGARADGVIAKVRSSPGPALLFAHGHLLRVLAALGRVGT